MDQTGGLSESGSETLSVSRRRRRRRPYPRRSKGRRAVSVSGATRGRPVPTSEDVTRAEGWEFIDPVRNRKFLWAERGKSYGDKL